MQTAVNEAIGKASAWLAKRFELSRGAKGNLLQMEGIRAVAVFLVFLVHDVSSTAPFLNSHTFSYTFILTIGRAGNIGVDIFFVLSGYLIYGSLINRPQPFFKYLQRRLERIYPTFLVVLLVYLFLSFIFPEERKIPPEADRAFFYLLANVLLLPGLFPIQPIITVAWSLSYEMFYYLMIPFVVRSVRLGDWQPSKRIGFFGFLIFAFLIIGSYGGWPLRLGTFVVGILVFELVHARTPACPRGDLPLLGLFAAIVLPDAPFYGPLGMALKQLVQWIGLGYFCLGIIDHPSSLSGSFLCWTPLRWLGNMSYSYYLMHGLAIKFSSVLVRQLVHPESLHAYYFFFTTPVLFLVTLPPTMALYLIIERPLSLAGGGANIGRPAVQELP